MMNIIEAINRINKVIINAKEQEIDSLMNISVSQTSDNLINLFVTKSDSGYIRTTLELEIRPDGIFWNNIHVGNLKDLNISSKLINYFCERN